MSAEPHPFLAVGDRVRVKFGPLAGLEGFLVQKKNQTRFVLSMNLIMQAISVEVDSADIERLSLTGLCPTIAPPRSLGWGRT
jgi:transcription antitermination factor NusG